MYKPSTYLVVTYFPTYLCMRPFSLWILSQYSLYPCKKSSNYKKRKKNWNSIFKPHFRLVPFLKLVLLLFRHVLEACHYLILNPSWDVRQWHNIRKLKKNNIYIYHLSKQAFLFTGKILQESESWNSKTKWFWRVLIAQSENT